MTIDDSVRQQVESAVGHVFANPSIIKCALTHASCVSQRIESNERLELLGDSVLGLVVCDHLYARYPDADEGELTKIKRLTSPRANSARNSRSSWRSITPDTNTSLPTR